MMTVEAIQKYKQRQVVLNFYEDEALANREGFPFDYIVVTESSVQFFRGDQCRYAIDREVYPAFHVLPDFKNYFSLTNDQSRIEIYFPE
ncbi:hypothetical protein [Brevibacillus sp. SYSU BS000544]|uniref:hypothetical protein n=1 Tax=Brevibacillus sp. SYSU BS000544 TaxID=3416443 RepID=UPI003CE5461E